MSPDGIAIHSEGMVVFANPSAVRSMGASAAGGPHRTVDASTSSTPTSRASVIASAWRRLDRGRARAVRGGEVRSASTARVIDVEGRAMPFTYDDTPAVQVVIRDISDRKRAETLQARALPHRRDQRPPCRTCRPSTASIHGRSSASSCTRENFYLALRDEETGSGLTFEYFVDEVDDVPPRGAGRARP